MFSSGKKIKTNAHLIATKNFKYRASALNSTGVFKGWASLRIEHKGNNLLA